MADSSITGELLKKAVDKTEEAIKRNNLSVVERITLENQMTILSFIREDHSRVVKLYEEYEDKKERRAWFDRHSAPVITAVLILSVTNFILFVSEALQKIKQLP